MTALLVDEGIGIDLLAPLWNQGYTAIHWLHIGAKGAHDSLVFLETQQRGLTVFTLNRDDFRFAAICWENWKLGNHHGVIAPRRGPQPAPPVLLAAMDRFCADQSSFINRIELF